MALSPNDDDRTAASVLEVDDVMLDQVLLDDVMGDQAVLDDVMGDQAVLDQAVLDVGVENNNNNNNEEEEEEEEECKMKRAKLGSGGTVCAVCNTFSANHHIHYGALTCFSCRAFFRRAHASRGRSSPGYVCKLSNTCDVVGKKRKKCQRCRYDKCIAVGMRPCLVLNDDQKRLRFRKMLERRRDPQPANNNSTITASNSHNSSSNRSSKRSKDEECSVEGRVKDCDVLLTDDDNAFTNDSSNVVRVKEEEEEEEEEETMSSWPTSSTSSSWEDVHESHLRAGILSELLLSDPISVFSTSSCQLQESCLTFRQVASTHPIPNSLLMSLVSHDDKLSVWRRIGETLSRRLQLFADNTSHKLSESNFESLSFVHLFILLLVRRHQDQSEVRALFNPQSKGLWTHEAQLSPEQIRDALATLVLDWSSLDSLSEQLLLVLSPYAVLNETRVVCMALMLLNKWPTMKPRLLTLATRTQGCLDNLQSVLECCKSSTPTPSKCSLRPLSLRYTREEEYWLQHQMHIFHTWFQSIPLGQELLNEFVMYSYDVPLSKRFVPNELATFVTRLRAIVDANPELNNLSGDERGSITDHVDVVPAVALCAVKAESFPSGHEQLRFVLGKADLALWEDRFSRVSSSCVLKKVLISEWNKTSNALDSHSLMNYLHLTGGLSSSVTNSDAFAILALLALFSGRGLKEELDVHQGGCAEAQRRPPLKSLQCKLMHLVRRRCFDDHGAFARIVVDLRHVDQLTPIFDKLLAL